MRGEIGKQSIVGVRWMSICNLMQKFSSPCACFLPLNFDVVQLHQFRR